MRLASLSVALVLGAICFSPVLGKDSPSKPTAKQAPRVLRVTAEPLKIDSGKVRGLVIGDADDVHLYRGIPYAAPPLGDLRWRAPQPPADWAGTRECFDFGAAAPQASSPMLSMFPGMTLGASTNEDCLYLNVWSPAEPASTPRPVMVWIHGGGYVMGAASQGLYDMANLARRGVVVVSMNYRLGALGFLAHPQLSAESPIHASGNYGLLDQIEALRWVQRNIASFGGDPGRVTIFGESAGGGSVLALMVSPLAKGLFHRAIAESGPALNLTHLTKPHYGFESGEQVGLDYAKKAGAPEGEGQLAALRAMSVEDLLKHAPTLEGQRDFNLRASLLRMAPVVDGWLIPDDPMTLLAAGKQNDVPLIVGANADEGTMFTMMGRIPTSTADAEKLLDANFGALGSTMRELYPVRNTTEIRRAVADMLGDVVFVAPARYVARQMRNVKSSAYLYHFAHPPVGPTAKLLGAHHGAEIAYAIDTVSLAGALSTVDEQIRDAMIGYWVQFATTGDPNREGLPEWPAYSVDADRSLVIRDAVAAEANLRQAKLDAIDAFMQAWRTETGVAGQ